MQLYQLQRLYWRKKPRRDWSLRWMLAGRAVKWKGVFIQCDKNGKPTDAMIASKASPIWRALAKGEGGFKDAVGDGKPPFAYNSGMGWAVKPYDDQGDGSLVPYESYARTEREGIVRKTVGKLMSQFTLPKQIMINLVFK